MSKKINSRQGWVRIYRKILDWEWWDDPNVFRVFIYLLLKANHQQAKWQGIQVQKGQLVTSYPTVKQQTKLSLQQVRTSFFKLKSTGEITVKTTNKYSLVSINNYEQYQSDEQSDEQSSNSQATVKQHQTRMIKKEKKEKNNDVQLVYEFYIEQSGSKEALSTQRRQKIKSRLKEFGLEKCKLAILGALNDPFLMGENDRDTRYANLDYIFRNFEKTEKCVQLAIKNKVNEEPKEDELFKATVRARGV